MSHITQFIIIHDDGHSQSIVGNPSKNRAAAEEELRLLILSEEYQLDHLQIVQVPA